MKSARRVICGVLISILGAYLFFTKNDAFNPSLLGADLYEIAFYYVIFALLGLTIVAGFLLYKDLMVGGILAIACASVVVVWITFDLLEGWSGTIYTLEQDIQHLHRVVRDILLPCVIVGFGIVGLGRGQE